MAKYTTKDVEALAEAQSQDEANTTTETPKKAKTTKKSAEKAAKKFEPSDMIPCHSICQGVLVLEGPRTKMPYEWVDYGATEDVEYRDLAELVRLRSEYLFNPFFIVDNEDFINEFSTLKKFYEENYSIKELGDILELPVDEMVKEIKALPKGAVDTLKSIAASQVSAGQLDSVRKIRELDAIFHTDLNLLSNLFE